MQSKPRFLQLMVCVLLVLGLVVSAQGTPFFMGLGDLPGGSFSGRSFGSAALGISADGMVVVGHSLGAMGNEAFRWTSGGGMVGLGDLPGEFLRSSALGVSGDGSVVVGGGLGALGGEAFIWDATNGMLSLQSLLVSDRSLVNSLRGWRLSEATAVSSDGLVMVGRGINPNDQQEGWIAGIQGLVIGPDPGPGPAPIPEPSTMLLMGTGLAVLVGWRHR